MSVIPGQRWRHVKRGTSYVVEDVEGFQTSVDALDGAELVLYRGADGKLWAREIGEFTDGRFEQMGA